MNKFTFKKLKNCLSLIVLQYQAIEPAYSSSVYGRAQNKVQYTMPCRKFDSNIAFLCVSAHQAFSCLACRQSRLVSDFSFWHQVLVQSLMGNVSQRAYLPALQQIFFLPFLDEVLQVLLVSVIGRFLRESHVG
jgi:hypothetical protein